jgi:hypothetical protein
MIRIICALTGYGYLMGTSEQAVRSDAEREVPLVDDSEVSVLPDQTGDDEPDWSELREDDHEVRLFEERPPHWDT